LEAHAEQPGTPGALERCSELLHEVCGVLRVVEVYGAALLAEEMEHTARFLAACPPGSRPHGDGLESLMRALVQLPAYVERVLAGGRDLTLVLLPLLNDLRAVRGSPLLSEGTLLVLNLSSDRQPKPQAVVPGETPLDAQQWARRLRTRFQVGLLGWIRGEHPQQNLEALAEVAERLEQVSVLQPVFQFWWVVGAVIEALREGGLEASATPKRLLGQADRELKRLYEEGEAHYAAAPNLELLNNLLYYVANTSTAGERVEAVRTSFRLQELLPVSAAIEREREHLAAPSVALMRTVGAAIREDLTRVKDVLDIFVRKGAQDAAELIPQVELLRKISDTLGVLDLGALRARVRAEVSRLEDMVAGRLVPSDRLLVEVAATLISVEDGLDEALVSLVTPGSEDEEGDARHDGHDAEQHRIQAAVLRECIVNLARIKEAVAGAVAQQVAVPTAAVDELARGIGSALWMLDRERARDVMASLAVEVHSVLLAPASLTTERLDRLADAMVSVEYYMETLEAGRTDPEYMLDNAEACLRALAAPPLPVVVHLTELAQAASPVAPDTALVVPETAAQAPELFAETMVLKALPDHESTVVDLVAAVNAEAAAQTVAPEVAPPAVASVGTPVSSTMLDTQKMPASTPQLDPHVDGDLIELFIQEAREEVAAIEAAFPRWADNPAQLEALVRVRRAFHTLKGSGRMVGARAVSEFAWSMESLLNRVLNGTLPRSSEIVTVMTAAVAELPGLVAQLAAGGELPAAAGWVAARAMALAEGRDPASVAEPFLLLAGAPRPAGAPTIVTPVTLALTAQRLASVEVAPQTAPAALAELSAEALAEVIPEVTVEVMPETLSEVTAPVEPETLSQVMPEVTVEVMPEVMPEVTPEVLPEVLPAPVFAAAPSEPVPQAPGYDPQLAEIYRAETTSHLAAIAAFLSDCGAGHAPHVVTEALHRACHTLAGASKMAEVPAGTALAEPLNLYIRKLYDHGLGLDADALPVVQALAVSIGEVAARLDQPAGELADHSALLAKLEWLRDRLDAQIALQGLAAPAPEVLPSDPVVATGLPIPEAVDPEIASIFAEEASELLESADAALTAWRIDPRDPAPAAELKRTLHTLKGGARMAGLHAMGALGHAAESLIGRIESTADATQVAPLLGLLQDSLDHLAVLRDGILGGRYEPVAPALLASLTAPVATNEPAPNLDAVAEPVEQQEVPPTLPIAAESAVVIAVAEPAPAEPTLGAPTLAAPTLAEPVVPPPGRELQPAAEPRELARVDAELLDDLLNNAGEVSILRARLEQQWNSVESNLAELSRVTTRLKEQLRRLELETEAQILARHETDAHRGAFDPLEMDRYSSLHQYSRALAESASDVASLQSLLEQLTRDGQNLLMQQARSVSEMQNGLMRSRMVAFQRHVPRLSRLVRQVASESGKRADLVVTGASGELDRQVLERLVGPFEHLLRNAVVHGIELPAVREAAGKLAEGRIEVALHRENSEMVITIADDGAGLDLRAIRERARARGLVAPGAVLTDGQAMQLVLEPGFSTATTLTADAGRGVGMDVVATAVKKLGGSLHMESVAGRGARFTLRLPFTLAISQALIVRTADELYALPLPTVEAVVRLTRSEVARYLVGTVASYEYGGQFYRFEHLGRFIGAPLAQLPEQDNAVPVVLVRSGENSTALVIDELLGNREVVVKAVGPQVASIEGIAGATILGDGRVVLILDMPTLVRRGARVRDTEAVQERVDRRAFALVVDDSITVRRVTQRLLERHGMRVATARDGVDALTILQDHVPDIVLLDIEMPRMDGYELATQIRADARLRDVPIVMITSRVGDKHRAKAIEIGVDDYLGKPYQESQLLDAIEPLLARRQASNVGLDSGRPR
jgi:chemosensory pili system protein ChpA (sensor histidine kinase/response regulator)